MGRIRSDDQLLELSRVTCWFLDDLQYLEISMDSSWKVSEQDVEGC